MDRWDLYNPSPGVLIESVENAWLKSLEDHVIGTLDLTVSTWVSDRGLVDPDAVSITKVQELLPSEVSPVVGDDAVRNAELVDDVEEEFDGLFQVNVGDGLGFYPLGELVDRYEQVSKVAWALFEGSYHVEAPDHEWPGDGDGLELLCWQMSLPTIELASFTPADDLFCIS